VGGDMKIERVSFKKLVSTGNFSNIQIGAEGIVENETPEDALTNLAYWVCERLNKMGANIEDEKKIESEIRSLEVDKYQIEKQIFDLKKKAEAMAEFLKKHGVELKDDIPF
jgi:hypothetical protein